jgi:general secretion pathway protein K
MMAAKQQNGVALITALLITALVTVATVAMATRQQLDIRRTGNHLEADQAYLYALGIEEWAKQILRRDAQDSNIDDLQEDWATLLPPLPVEGGSIQGSLEDMQGRFNLNSLLDADGNPDTARIEGFQELMAQVDAGDDELTLSPFLANAVVDWIDANLNSMANGAEDLDYLNERVPYRAANRFMASPSELQAVAGFSARAVKALQPLVAALPERTAVNVNTAPELVLMSLDDNMTPRIAQAIVDYRASNPFTKASDFVDYMDRTHGIQLNADTVDVQSHYFAVTALAVIGRMEIELHSLLVRNGTTVTTIRRSIGVY